MRLETRRATLADADQLAWWGAGVAPVLHEAAITERRARELARTRLTL